LNPPGIDGESLVPANLAASFVTGIPLEHKSLIQTQEKMILISLPLSPRPPEQSLSYLHISRERSCAGISLVEN
jgi:hypothetical protein